MWEPCGCNEDIGDASGNIPRLVQVQALLELPVALSELSELQHRGLRDWVCARRVLRAPHEALSRVPTPSKTAATDNKCAPPSDTNWEITPLGLLLPDLIHAMGLDCEPFGSCLLFVRLLSCSRFWPVWPAKEARLDDLCRHRVSPKALIDKACSMGGSKKLEANPSRCSPTSSLPR